MKLQTNYFIACLCTNEEKRIYKMIALVYLPDDKRKRKKIEARFIRDNKLSKETVFKHWCRFFDSELEAIQFFKSK